MTTVAELLRGPQIGGNTALAELVRETLAGGPQHPFDDSAIKDARQSLAAFSQFVDPTFKLNWHHALVAEHLEMLARGDIRRLMVLEPPGGGKTTQCSIHFPAWILGLQDESIVGAAYNLKKAVTESGKLQTLLGTSRYQAVFPRVRLPKRSNVQKGHKAAVDEFCLLDRPRALYRACGIGTALTGFDKTLGIIDDPCKDQADAMSAILREKAWDWYGSTYRTRDREVIAGPAGVRDLLVTTPWHTDGLDGRILSSEGDKWHVLRLPAYLSEHSYPDRDPDDSRVIGEALWPLGSWPIEKLLDFQRTRPDLFQALFQCRPVASEGNLFKRYQFQNRFSRGDVGPRQGLWFVSVDAAFRGTETSSYVAIQVWCIDYDAQRAYLAHAQRQHLTFTGTVDAIKAVLALFPHCVEVMVEGKANGDAIIDVLHAQIGQVCTAYNPGTRSKVARANAISPWVEHGCVWLPEDAPWAEEFIGDVVSFPVGKASDPVDAMSQALTKMSTDAIPGMSAWGPILRRR